MRYLVLPVVGIAVVGSGAVIFAAQLASHCTARIAYAVSWWALCAGSIVAGLAQRLI